MDNFYEKSKNNIDISEESYEISSPEESEFENRDHEIYPVPICLKIKPNKGIQI